MNEKFKIEIVPVVGVAELARTMQHLWSTKGEPNLRRLYATSDSILEIPRFFAYCEAPRSVAMQMETHKKKYGFYLWMSSARPDIAPEAYKEYSREQSVKFVMTFTARAIIDIAHYRMCNKAEANTRDFMQVLKKELHFVAPELSDLLMPMCAYRNGLCTELRSCKNPQKYPQK